MIMIKIIKVGGAIIEDEKNLENLLSNFATIEGSKILVHGGGRTSSTLMKKLGMEPKMINGRRVTDQETLEIVSMVYAGINKKIVAKLQAAKINALGICGADGNAMKAKKRPPNPIDFGFVGDITKKDVDTQFIENQLKNKITLVFAPLTHDGKGNLLNTNADTVASTLAQAVQTIEDVQLLYVFEKPGLLRNADDDNSLITSFSNQDYRLALKQDFIHAGMHPKLKNAFDAVNDGVKEVCLCNIQNMTHLKQCTKITP